MANPLSLRMRVAPDGSSGSGRLSREPVLIEVRDLEKTFRIPEHKVDTLKERVVHPLRRGGVRGWRAAWGVSFDEHRGGCFGRVGRCESGGSARWEVLGSVFVAGVGR